MKVKISKFKPVRYPENEVKTGATFLPYRSGEATFDPDGLFSDVIFGRIGKCKCGKLRHPGFCHECNTRVVDINHLPDYWFDLGLEILSFEPLWKKINVDSKRLKQIKNILNYTHCLCLKRHMENGKEIVDASVEEIPDIQSEEDFNNFIGQEIYIGRDAAKILGATDEWLDENMISFIYIPHPIYRPLIRSVTNKPFVSPINNLYSQIITQANKVKEFLPHESSKLHQLVSYRKITVIYQQIITQLLDILQTSRYGILRSEIISHPISGAVRATLLNRHDINEDVLLIGNSFIKTLYPYLYSKYDGDMAKINKELIDKDYTVLLNRPPSISYMSIMGMKPRVASIYPEGKIDGTNGGLLNNEKYINSKEFSNNSLFVQGDVECMDAKFVGRNNYNNLYTQRKGNGEPIKVLYTSPYDRILPTNTIALGKKMYNVVRLKKDQKDKIKSQTPDPIKITPIETFLSKFGTTSNDDLISMKHVMSELEKLEASLNKDVDYDMNKDFTPYPLDKIDKSLTHLVMENKYFNNHLKEVDGMQIDKIEKSIAYYILKSPDFYWRCLETRDFRIDRAYNLQKKDLKKIQGKNAVDLTTDTMNLLSGSFLDQLEDNRDTIIRFTNKDISKMLKLDSDDLYDYIYKLVDENKGDQESIANKQIKIMPKNPDNPKKSDLIEEYHQRMISISHYLSDVFQDIYIESCIKEHNLNKFFEYDDPIVSPELNNVDGLYINKRNRSVDIENPDDQPDYNIDNDIPKVTKIVSDQIPVESIRAISINPIIEDGMGADTDGDVLFVAALYGMKACYEADQLISSKRYRDYAQGHIRNGIVEDIFYGQKDTNIQNGLRKYANLPRHEYFNKNEELAKDLWGNEDLPTVGDIAQYVQEGDNSKLDKVFDFFDNKEDFDTMVNKSTRKYDEQVSSEFIRKVMASNNKDISDAGYFYKKLMSSADDYTMANVEDCGQYGREFDVNKLDEEHFKFYVHSCYVPEFKEIVYCYFDEFAIKYKKQLAEHNGKFHTQSPVYCKYAKDHKVCRRCAGLLPKNLKNIGTFTCLGVTEFATQGALSSMNKGRHDNANMTVQRKGPQVVKSWQDIIDWVLEGTDLLIGGPVQARFYEIAFLSRIRPDGKVWFATALQHSISLSHNLFGAFIFQSNEKNLTRMINTGEFDDNSTKLRIAVNDYYKDAKKEKIPEDALKHMEGIQE